MELSVWCSALDLVSAVLAGSGWQSTLADVSWKDLDEHIPFPAAAISIPILEAVNGRDCLVGWLFSSFLPFIFPSFCLSFLFFLPWETVPWFDGCSGGEEHSLLVSSVDLTLYLMELFSLLGPSLSHTRSSNSIPFTLANQAKVCQFPISFCSPITCVVIFRPVLLADFFTALVAFAQHFKWGH